MCGIAGFYGFRNDNLIKKISKQLAHRGPDGEGDYLSDKVSLLNRRLATIDIKRGDQPIFNEDRSNVVVYNGEIYNFWQLRKELERYGHLFKTESDTEVIVHSYEQWKDNCFDRFNGMFAIALYDIKNDKLVLARDHFGIKPLYFSLFSESRQQISHSSGFPRARRGHPKSFETDVFDSHKLIFSSEIKPILESGLIKKKPNDKTIYRYLRYRVHDDQKETFFNGIYRLMPGEMMIVQSSKFKFQSFTKLREDLIKIRKTKKLGNRDVEKFRKKLIEAIRLRLISEVPVGTCLSGGLDSSTVVSAVNKLLKEKVKESRSVGKIQQTFSAVFPEGSNDEERYVNEVLESIKLESHKVKPKPEEFFNEVKEFIKTQEEPTISTGPYAQYKVMQEASKHVTVLLDGQGADEMMAGYLPYYFVYFRQLAKEKKYFKLIKELFLSYDILATTLIKHLVKVFGFKKEINANDLLNEKFFNQFKEEKFLTIDDNLKKRLIEDIFYNSLPSLLRYEDRNSMRYSIEGRVPFLDFNLLRYLFNLSDNAIINLGWNKNILRQSMKQLLPELILKRRNKIGFTTPEYQWFMRMKNKIYQIFLSESFVKRKYFNQPEVLKAFQSFIEGKVDDTMVFWRMLNLELWLRIFFDSKPIKKLTHSKINIFGEANEGKKLEVEVEGKKYLRYPVKTEVFKKGDNISDEIVTLLHGYIANNNETMRQCNNKKWFLIISEKIVAIAQGRSYFLWEIKPNFWAKLLSKYVTKTPYGIGLGSPWTMQLAIREIGVIWVIVAAIIAGITKPLGIKGVFYRIAGETVRSIDGPTEYSLYPSNVSAKLGPKDPQLVAKKIAEQVQNSKFKVQNFLGVAIIDANDLGQKVLGNSTNISNEIIEDIFKDNPMGQADEQTPIVIVFSI
ncbi:asparagine synthetase B [Candidatus Roizmanbacteria bacterium CG02_land_8_20_14_3_00_36_15]|uniref:asparagine synthase (glutamine-hydrolyzing) n=1 Tax=Candidatus Roizmanbacteria bacterium CG10_big_fil_rev_8_21_14_0_10_36_26 TaxID=1974851 RepID=A0A2M8KMI4_9BACT|nr:MAG: asparagine synthetase B [Candidatus Roizmanbacteria bacterium CG03_land_8_20_14_0_80_36_21]PIV37642.1 MAG: asparagine synthetase B [Candidatus Roizmanbacteria bacterium CG02_land_8_20_14_3_00_36_15]PIY69945.1 MAG: asparagine synthetase B [Candidatus Roizmanbacteria bacterium CG_4_10_14_0_8_um_filter_36_36]PJA53045.1 MAG: asparagine synthetase B [Candidatus Roizmanbacteria bacterium CG_4_9_14_3_um_filter_36_11]PJE61132.1 MAG: asparagine synthetase B [Candidatus Roizmanbacteria bacterium 